MLNVLTFNGIKYANIESESSYPFNDDLKSLKFLHEKSVNNNTIK